MQSDQLDETRPHQPQPEEQPAEPLTPSSEASAAPADLTGGEPALAGDTVPTPLAPAAPEVAPVAAEETQPTSTTPPVEVPSQPEPQPAAPEAAPVPAEATQPAAPAVPAEHPVKKKRRALWLLWAFLGLLILVIIAAGSAFLGYQSAITERTNYQSTQVSGEAQAQYDLALEDFAAKRYDMASQRLEYVIQLDPAFPGAADLLTRVFVEQRTTATPTLAPTPTPIPTPDFRGRDDLYAQGQNMLAGGDWSGAIDTLLTLRKKYPDFQAVDVDGMLYVALRNRGVDKIAIQSDLEGGTYDLTLAERFGPLDAEAGNWRDWAELYIRGASFWDVDWSQAVFYFSQLAPTAPNLTDASGWTSTERYLQSLLGYGDWLSAAGDHCLAAEQYHTYLGLRQDTDVEPTAVAADEQCAEGGGEDATPEPEGEATPSP